MGSAKNLNDQELLLKTKESAQAERDLTLTVIELLTEIQRRRLHLKRGFSSLHEYCVKELKYSDGAAFRRIKAMRLVESTPQVAEAIESGALNLTAASQLQKVFESKAKSREAFSNHDKLELINKVQNQSTRQVERILAEIAPEVINQTEKVKPVSKGLAKLELFVDEDFLKNLETLRSLTSHKNSSLKELFGSLIERELRRIDPEQKKVRFKKPLLQPKETDRLETEAPEPKLQSSIRQKPASAPPVSSVSCKQTSRYLSSSVKHQVWMRNKGQCTFIDPVTKRKCESKHRLQYEHIKPFARGGDNDANNLRLLCQSHNNLMAINQYGPAKMDKYLTKV